jgi:GntR family transcriptional regulator/MocR family aminotransferase
MVTGDLQRHLARAAREYRHRRDVIMAALSTRCPDLAVLGIEAGLHLAIPLPPDQDDQETVRRLAAHGFVVDALSEYPHAARGQINGLAVGFALINRSTANGFADSLAAVLSAER